MDETRPPCSRRLAGRAVTWSAATSCWLSALVAVPLLVGLVAVLELHTPFRFLLFPPLAALAYAIFTNPDHPSATVVGIVVAPTLTALLVMPIGAVLGTSAPAFGLAALVTIVLLRLARTTLVPPLALAVLIVLLRIHQLMFAVSVLAATLLLYAIFALWKRLLLDRWHPRQGMESGSDGPPSP